MIFLFGREKIRFIKLWTKKDIKDGKKQIRTSDLYKQVRDTGTWMQFIRKDMNKETLGLTDEDLDSVSKEFGLTAESIEDLLRLYVER